MYCPDSYVFHVGGGTLPKKSARKTYLNFRNNLSLLYKNLPSNQLFRVFLVRFPLDGVAALKFLLEGGFEDCLAVLRAHLYFYRNFSHLNLKRKARKHNAVDCIYKGHLITDYYIHKRKRFSQLDESKF